MHDAQLAANYNQSVALTPNCKLIDRFFALVIDCFFLAILLWVATHAFGMAQITQPGPTPSPPGALFNPGTVSGGYGSSSADGSTYSINWTITLTPLWQGLIVFLYFTLQEAFFGRTLGKKFMGLRVVLQLDETTYANLTLKAAILRNLLRFIDAIGMYLVGWIVALASPRRRRLGDMVAHTLVVNVESALYIRPLRKQRVFGLRVMVALLLAFLLGCALFTYVGKPPLVVQNLTLTQPDAFDVQSPSGIINISRYTLGQASWGHDTQGAPTITYPISYFAIRQTFNQATHQSENTGQTCQGSITLVWHWWPTFDWELLSYSPGSCGDV